MISIEESRCTQCGLCIPVCVRRILEKDEKGVRIIDAGMCLSCGHCKAICPTDAPIFSHLVEKEFEAIPKAEALPDPSAFLRFLRRRRSLRLYQSKPVELEKLQMILEAGRFAPTGANRQACEYVVVNNRKILDRVCTLATQALQEEGQRVKEALDRLHRLKEPLPEKYILKQFSPPVWDRIARKWMEEGVDQLFYHAPALVLIHMEKGVTTTPDVDTAMAGMQMVLMAESLALGTCFIGYLVSVLENSAELKKVLEIPRDHQAHVAFTVGYPQAKFLRLVGRNPIKVKWIGDSK